MSMSAADLARQNHHTIDGKIARNRKQRHKKRKHHGFNQDQRSSQLLHAVSPTSMSLEAKHGPSMNGIHEDLAVNGTSHGTVSNPNKRLKIHDRGAPETAAGINMRLESMLSEAIQYAKATGLTFEDEKKLLLQVKIRGNASATRRRQSFLDGANISNAWPEDVRSKPYGLENPGALCYRRSILQTLLHLPAFINWLNPTLSVQPISDHKHSSEYPNSIESCLLCKLRTLVASCWTKSTNSQLNLSRNLFDKAVAIAGRLTTPRWRTVSKHVQADAHEFLGWLIEVFETYFNNPLNTIRTLFKIRIESEWTCAHCRAINTGPGQDELGLQLPLDLPDRPNNAQTNSLSAYVAAYFSQTGVEIRCETCSHSALRTRTHSISLAPEVLVIQLQRFRREQNMRTGQLRSVKIEKSVTVPEQLDLSSYATNAADRSVGSLKYRLSSVVQHCGTLSLGHYITVARGPGGVSKFDDEEVRPSSIVEMLQPRGRWTPYVLIYIAE